VAAGEEVLDGGSSLLAQPFIGPRQQPQDCLLACESIIRLSAALLGMDASGSGRVPIRPHTENTNSMPISPVKTGSGIHSSSGAGAQGASPHAHSIG
jgi:hypothetical protein